MQNAYGSQVIKVCGRHSYLEKRNGLVTVTRTKIKVRDDIKKSWNLAEKGVRGEISEVLDKDNRGDICLFCSFLLSEKFLCAKKTQGASINSKNTKILVFDLF